MDLNRLAPDFAAALMSADSKRPQAVNARSGMTFQPGIGPHAETEAVRLVTSELELTKSMIYRDRIALGVPYPDVPRQKCDLCIGQQSSWEWAIEIKMLRFLGDNGKLNDNILMHILSPYPAHRSALTDCSKLVNSPLGERKAILIYGFAHEKWPLAPAIDAFERLAGAQVQLGSRHVAGFGNLVHPIHDKGRVFVWEIS